MMDKNYFAGWWGVLGRWASGRAVGLAVLACLLGTTLAQAQSGTYGNEWIVPGQPYYKVKVWRDGLYRLDYAYLSQLGAGAVAPTQLQVWRRGREVAVYQGGNSATLDNSTFVEFYGQRNDAALDKEFYKNPADQVNPFYSFYTDTAAYFVTWGARAGKRMTQPVAAGGTPHGWRLQSSLVQKTVNYAEGANEGSYTYLPWIEPGEGFFQGQFTSQTYAPLDSVLRAVATGPGVPAPQLEAVAVGGFRDTKHLTAVQVIPPGSSTARTVGILSYTNYNHGYGRFALLGSDISSAGQVTVSFDIAPQPRQAYSDAYRWSWWRVTAPQQNVWFSNRQQVAFQNDSLLSGPATYEVDNIPGTVSGFDVHDPWNVQRVAATTATTLGSTGRRYVFPSATGQQTRRLLLADEAQALVPPAARRVNFRVIDPVKPNFVIITHPQLMKAAGTVPNVARAYANYRASVAGGGYDTLMVTAPQLYDQFHYGERSVIALRHFALWLAARSPASQSKFLLLLGKGISPGTAVSTTADPNFSTGFAGFNASLSARVVGENGLDLVPISTRSSSDIFLSSDWPHDNYVPALATGRVVATTPAEALAYLNKLQEYEAQLSPTQLNPEPWHKNMVHLSGGQDQTEISNFRTYLDGYKRRVEHPLLGGSVTTYQRVYDPAKLPANKNISADVNAGLALITYFGHGSTTQFDLNIGDINDPTQGYNNAKKYPVMMYNGCSAGAAFFNAHTFATDWLLAANKGSIGIMAESGLSYADLLNPSQDLTHQLLFNDPDWFGRPIAEVRREVIRRLQSRPEFAPIPGNLRAPEQLLSTVWQGDPALRMYAPAKPDFVASAAALSLNPIAPDVAVTAASTKFTLTIGVSNPLRITRDSVEIRVTRTYPTATGLAPEVYVFNNHNGLKPFPQAFRRDTTYTITLTNPTSDFSGDNKFTVELDYRNKVAELDETNNTATLTYAFLKRGLTLLTPTEFAIITSTKPRLVAQSNDPSSPVRGYDFQVDSVASFNSPALQSTTVSAGATPSWTPSRALTTKADSTVWYWRVRFTTAVAPEDAGWQVSSFRIIPTALSGGWSQSHNGQFNRDDLQGVAVATPGNRWSFVGQQQAVVLRTAGGGLPGSPYTFSVSGYGINTGAAVDVSACGVRAPNLLLAVFDPLTLAQTTVGGSYSVCGTASQPFYYFGADPTSGADTLDNLNNSAARRAQLLDFLSKVPEGAYVGVVSQNRLRYAEPALAATLRQVATLLGSKVLPTLKNGEPWALVAQKKASGSVLLAETGPDRTLATPTYLQSITLNSSLSAPSQSGSITSTLIGPAVKWQTLFDVIKPETSTAKYTLSLVGIDASNQATVLQADIKAKSLDLSGYSATTYPYMQLQLALSDPVSRVPPQLKQWLITYKGKPEGVVRRDLVAAAVYDSASLKAQATTGTGFIKFPVKFDNISQEAFASRLQTQVQLVNATTNLPVRTLPLLTATRDLLPGDSVLTVNVSLDMRGLFGKFYVRVVVNPQLQPELYYFNNELKTATFTVRDNNVPPTLDVAVDGRHILDGELVAPRPLITIQLKDEDKLRLITDASYFTVFLQKDGGSPVPVDVNGSQVHFTVDNTSGSLARLDYQPGLSTPLLDGTYTLRVQGRDPSNASAGTVDYQVKFTVVNESKISNVYPYPNPVTSKAKFVFTVTGQDLPRNMKIQIMTLTGRVVREIFMSELGPLHIGNNVTDYAWDGTDQYGDRLANGTYLYRVAVDDPNNDFKKFSTAGDQAFKNDWGKLVLLR